MLFVFIFIAVDDDDAHVARGLDTKEEWTGVKAATLTLQVAMHPASRMSMDDLLSIIVVMVE
jgi:hypothetical protein